MFIYYAQVKEQLITLLKNNPLITRLHHGNYNHYTDYTMYKGEPWMVISYDEKFVSFLVHTWGRFELRVLEYESILPGFFCDFKQHKQVQRFLGGLDIPHDYSCVLGEDILRTQFIVHPVKTMLSEAAVHLFPFSFAQIDLLRKLQMPYASKTLGESKYFWAVDLWSPYKPRIIPYSVELTKYDRDEKIDELKCFYYYGRRLARHSTETLSRNKMESKLFFTNSALVPRLLNIIKHNTQYSAMKHILLTLTQAT